MSENKGWDFGRVGEAEAQCGHSGDPAENRASEGEDEAQMACYKGQIQQCFLLLLP